MSAGEDETRKRCSSVSVKGRWGGCCSTAGSPAQGWLNAS